MTVTLREVTDDDVAEFFEHQLDSEATAMALFPSRSREDHDAHWRKILANDANITRTIDVDGAVAGNLGSWIQDGQREVGYWLGREFWGRGVATEALRQFLLLVPERPVFAWIARHNTGSIRVAQKAGFVHHGDDDEGVIFVAS